MGKGIDSPRQAQTLRRNKLSRAGAWIAQALQGWPAVFTLLAGVAATAYVAAQLTHLEAENYRDQFFRAGLAQELVRSLQQKVDAGSPLSAVTILQSAKPLSDLFPEADFYILDSSGRITDAVFEHIDQLDSQTVPLESIQQFLNDPVLAHGPISIPLPDDTTFESVFSVAPFQLSGHDGYVFVTLHNRNRRLFSIAWTEHRHLLGTVGLLILVVSILLAASWLLRHLFQRIFRRVTNVLNTLAPELANQQGPSSGKLSYEEQMVQLVEGILGDRSRLQGREDEVRQIVARVTHDIRTPLMLIQDYADRLLSAEPESVQGDVRKDGARMRRNVRSLAALVSDLDVFDELKDARNAVRLEPIDLPELLHDLADVYTVSAQAKEIELSVVVDPKALPPASGDLALLDRLLRNIIDNAIRHTRPGGKIELRATLVEGANVRVAVSDSGIGIPQSGMARIFEPFFQLQGEMRENGSSGLGLAIAQEAVHRIGSTLHVESTEGEGTTFWFELALWVNGESDATV